LDHAGDTFLVTISGVSSQAVFMDERPERDAGIVATSAMVAQWESLGFGEDPPNAFLSGSDLPPVPLEILHRPDYTDEGTLIFEAALLGTFAGSSLATSIQGPVLFIDAATPPDTDLLDLTMSDIALEGELGGSLYAITAEPADVVSGDPVVGSTCPYFLACVQAGLYSNYADRRLEVQFSSPVDIDALIFLDFYSSADGSTRSELTVSYSGVSQSFLSDPTETPDSGSSGTLVASVGLTQVTSLTIAADFGEFTLAGILVSSS
jgi:hypothetical protein